MYKGSLLGLFNFNLVGQTDPSWLFDQGSLCHVRLQKSHRTLPSGDPACPSVSRFWVWKLAQVQRLPFVRGVSLGETDPFA